MPTVTLHCESGNHDWNRETVRGRYPRSCPAHGGPIHVAAASVIADTVDEDMVALYMDETRQSARIVRAFVLAGIEPPSRDTTDQRGFTTRETAILVRSQAAPALDRTGAIHVDPDPA